MAVKKNKDSKAWMVPEGETRDNATHHFIHRKSISMIREGKKLRMKKYHPGLRKHVWFIETKMPPHNKN
jgi:ribosomal protein L33